MTHRLKLVYAAGPGNVIGTYLHWRDGREDPTQVARTYSGQFYDVVRELNAQALVISSHASGETVQDGDFRIEHRPIPLVKSSGVLYHVGQVSAALRLLWKAWRYRADVLVVQDSSCHWFPLRLAPLLGIRVIPTLHCALWCHGTTPGKVAQFFHRLAGPFFARSASRILAISVTITNQLDELTRGQHPQVLEFLPSYLGEQFAELQPPPEERTPFRVFFAGRIERNKGVFDLLEVAKRLDREGRTDIEFDLAGEGSSFVELKQAVAQSGEMFIKRFRLHGQLQKEQMRELFSRSHVVIVPTTSSFSEGMNKVVVEGVLSGRPVITSRVSNALEYVGGAVFEVPPDDTQAYGDAILQLRDNRTLYDEKLVGCRAAQTQFYEPSRGWGAMLKTGLLATISPR